MTVKLENVEVVDWVEAALRDLEEGPIVIERNGRAVGALVPADMLELLERIEDESYRPAIVETQAEAGEIPWEEVKAESRALP
jgi:hypothetical protein